MEQQCETQQDNDAAVKDKYGAARKRWEESKQSILQGMRDIAGTINLDKTRRPENLRLLRTHANKHQRDFCSFSSLGPSAFSSSQCSNIERGKAILTDIQARQIELSHDLPVGWLDRDNSVGLRLTNDEWRVIQLLRKAPQEARPAIIVIAELLAGRDHCQT
ncbi:MAG: hypothetical protein OHM77_07985 [Candidatus Nitricoxidivorans perseverans]|uniref:Uncharacterized protein n=1 Tax=Candidatus Nitricoxidivorans perseverans TaxID=2975601 RepID=A0AA49FIK7_9PROT|nr:MAG: hypothetical protein OHM77_07985 [Candidatus Nitricoxidivorans perseverans]